MHITSEGKMTYKGLLRQSRPRQDDVTGRDKTTIQLPLIAKSPAMQAFVERCLHMAKMGHFVVILGHPGYTIEVASLFQKLTQELCLENPIIASPGNERLAILEAAENETVDALLVSCAAQILPGTQEFMSEGHLSHLRLVVLCYETYKRINLGSLIRPSLFERCGEILHYPAWHERTEDHADCLSAAMNVAEKHYSHKLDFGEQDLSSFLGKNWRSVAHMVADVITVANLRNQSQEVDSAIHIKL